MELIIYETGKAEDLGTVDYLHKFRHVYSLGKTVNRKIVRNMNMHILIQQLMLSARSYK